MAFGDMTTLMIDIDENIEINTVLGYWFNRLGLFRLGYRIIIIIFYLFYK